MKVRRTFWVLMLAGAVVWLPLRGAYAAGYQCDITNDTPIKSGANTVAKGQIKIAPSKKKGDGGSTIQLNVSGVSCGSKCNNNVIDVGVRALGTDVPDAAGILFNVVSGKTVFPGNGKNKESLGGLFGALTSVVFNNSLGIGQVSLREPASDPSACSQVPLATGNHCTDGAIYAVAGFVVPPDPTLLCTTDTDCGTVTLTEVCDPTSHLCVVEQCAADSDCRSGMCNINSGMCCQTGVGAGCPAP